METGYLDMDLLRFTTAGSVDDGKSTLIGRLLYDCKSIFEDQLEAVEASSKKRGDAIVNLALLTDGLRAEREQGITIDVAYRYFATPKRKFIISDTPGHIQYTRNMVTGASTASLAIILVDARKGVIEQTKRHFFITQLLGIKYIIFAVNKMDLVDYDQAIFEEIKSSLLALVEKHGQDGVAYHFTPVSALYNENIVAPSKKLTWHKGAPLLQLIEALPIEKNQSYDAAFQIQYVIRPKREELHDYRGFAGNVRSGSFAVAAAKAAGADAYVTADLKYHDFFAAEHQILLLDIGHYESEQYTKNLLVRFLTKKIPNFAVLLSKINTNPVKYI